MNVNVRSYVTLEVAKDDRMYLLSLPMGSQYEEIFGVLEQLKEGVAELQRRSLEQQAQSQKPFEPEITE